MSKKPTHYSGHHINTPHRFLTLVNVSRENRSFLRPECVLCSAFFEQINLRLFSFCLKINHPAQNLPSDDGFCHHFEPKHPNHYAQNIPYDLPHSGMNEETNNEKD